VQGKSRSW